MAPEQLLGSRTDFRADHFALGVILYEIVHGLASVRRRLAAIDDRAHSRRRANAPLPR